MVNLFEEKKIPYICTPITGKTNEAIFEQLAQIIPKQPDMIEWRADFFENLHDVKQVLEVLVEMKKNTKIPLLFTIRSIHEGGEQISLTEEEKVALIEDVCTHSPVDLVDYETSNDETFVKAIAEQAREQGKTLILSYHNFTSTPNEAALLARAEAADASGADIIKLAVMPETKEDVFRLLHVTRKLDKSFKQPIITMSMGELGAVSRINGWLYGSCLTFAVGVDVSAPGQMAIEPLRAVIEETKGLLPAW